MGKGVCRVKRGLARTHARTATVVCGMRRCGVHSYEFFSGCHWKAVMGYRRDSMLLMYAFPLLSSDSDSTLKKSPSSGFSLYAAMVRPGPAKTQARRL